MDRTLEFFSMINLKQTSKEVKQDTFYETLYYAASEILVKSIKLNSLRLFCKVEEELDELQKRANLLLGSIVLDGKDDLKLHFDGIKYIINNKILNTRKKVELGKGRMVNREIELEPEKGKAIKNLDLIEQVNGLPRFSAEMQELELESRKIVEQSQYEETRQRIAKIDVVQRAINENLVIQNERIDSIVLASSNTSNIYKTLTSDPEILGGKGSFMRRLVFNIILFFSFILIFIHFYYRE